ncbi:hypothetical protein Cme02nite_14510 [Catellatospora methionotrophica]|uniref:Uncharacterized protein n=1 Tax=Catellatospora methionotrophica TaxID=121620 RepID=A0A8J3LCG1_9ACTN|nr:hypothetical protein [Catellatospora methionotrophica]GIG13119.1 hypothetical protein Cme02nite_14510 [Catellatospora methionotrophica]
MSDNPYRAPAPPAAPVPVQPAAYDPAVPAVAAGSDSSPNAPAQARRPVEAGSVWRGIFTMLGAHALTMVVGLVAGVVFGRESDYGPLADGDQAYVFVVVGVFAQFILGIVALVTGIGGIIRRDGGKGSGLLIGWVAGIPASLIAGIVITASLANM